MTAHSWIVRNQKAESIILRSTAFGLKVGIEASVSALLALIGAIPVYLIVTETTVAIPYQADSLFSLWGTFTAIIFLKGWCFLTREPEE